MVSEFNPSNSPKNNAIVLSNDVQKQLHRPENPDLLTQYLAEVRRYPILSAEEEKEYAIKYYEDEDKHAGA